MWGIFVNIYEDITMKLSPINDIWIKKMLKNLKWYQILSWTRWDKSINFDLIATAIENTINGMPKRGLIFLFGTPFEPLLAGIKTSECGMPLNVMLAVIRRVRIILVLLSCMSYP